MLLTCFLVGPSSSWDFLWMTMSRRGGCPSAPSLAVEKVAGLFSLLNFVVVRTKNLYWSASYCWTQGGKHPILSLRPHSASGLGPFDEPLPSLPALLILRKP